ncbi:hypothetical protein HUK80_00385 [Flavobacterium sp. MAH-1]|uniref:DUF4421 domain-containing protein n=1 Tax=Flavobacterium agri TaxID=2743471 RepID=A0A7Y8XZU6_9FLAO|nr:hypothetical protein [Flavobacterium agri]NUY79334.1 hypothetical protein [Flavobacterium agri]NYA69358.1 hypothetical protein [Flavobacterium agri]
MKHCIWILCCLIFTSCATLLNKSHYDILFSSDKQNTTVTIQDSTYKLPAKVNVRRQKKNLAFTVKNDSLSKNFTLFPYTDSKIALNATQSVYMPIGFAVDLLSPQRFTYGKFVNIAIDGDSVCVYGANPRAFGQKREKRTTENFNYKFSPKKGEWYFTPAISQYTQIDFSNAYGDFHDFSLASVRANFDYAYKDDRYVSVGVGYVAPINTIGEHFGPYDHDYPSAFFATVTDNFAWQRLEVGYGLGYAMTNVRVLREINEQFEATFTNHSLAANLGISLRLHKRLYANVNYVPTFYKFSPSPEWHYEHLLNFGFRYKLRLRKAAP